MMSEKMLPTFIVAGAKKAATTSLYEYFKQHPQVYMSAIKETNFFAYEADNPKHSQAERRKFPIRTMAEYTNLFVDTGGAKAVGEASPFYISSLTASQRLHKVIPEIQLIFSLRNPVDRAYSDYLMRARGGTEQRTVDQAFQEDLELLRARTYYKQLQPWYGYFSSEQIRVVLFEEIKEDAVAVMQKLYRFIDVDADFTPDVAQQHNPGGIPKNQTRQAIVNFVRQYRYFRTCIPKSIRNRFSMFAEANLQKAPPLPAHIRAKLMAMYAEDTARLEELIGIDLSIWQTGNLEKHPPITAH